MRSAVYGSRQLLATKAICYPVERFTKETNSRPLTMSEYLFTSESVSEGHPDKVADQISDAVLDAILAQDKFARVAAETLVNTGLVRDGRRDHHHRDGGFPAGRARHHQAHRLRQHRVRHRLQGLRRAGGLRQAVARHQAGRGQGAGRSVEPGRRRPGPDVRLRLRGDAAVHAAADLSCASAGRAPVGSCGATAACPGCGRMPSRRSPCATPMAARSASTRSCCPRSMRPTSRSSRFARA